MATKVFVGNLSFKIQEEKLREEFGVAGNVLSANIITRGPRSLGYGFVEFASLEDANKSVDLLHNKEIDGRKINVEVARPRAEPPAQQEGERSYSDDDEGRPARRRPRRRQAPRTGGAAPGATNQTAPGGQQQQRGPRQQGGQQQEGGPPKRQYRPRPPQNQSTSGNADGQTQTNAVKTTTNNNHGGNDTNPRPFKPRNFRRNNNRGSPSAGGQQQQQPQQPQQPQQTFQRKRPAPQPKRQQERVPSSTTLFVANLPFSVDDKELAEIFSKNLKVVSAHVVKKRNTRSKGFGFVVFDNEADQLAALKEFDGATVHERPLNVKVALTAVPGDETPGTEKPVEGEAAKHVEEETKESEAPKVEAAQPAKEKAEAAAPAAAAAAAEAGEEKKGGQ